MEAVKIQQPAAPASPWPSDKAGAIAPGQEAAPAAQKQKKPGLFSGLSGIWGKPKQKPPAEPPVAKKAEGPSPLATHEAVHVAKMQKAKGIGLVQSYKKLWANMLLFSGSEMDARLFSIYLIAGSIVLGLAASVFLSLSLEMAILAVIGAFAVMHILVYSKLYLDAESRANKVEEVLPDFLSLVSSNIRSGLTPDKALVVSARDEFGPLTVAINKAAKKSITGMPLDEVMMGMTEQIHSNLLEKTMTQIVEGIHSGGDLPELLEKTALDIRKFRSVKKEVNSIILNYELFIIAAITFGAPMLYGVSTFLVDIMIIIKGKIGGGAEAVSQLSGSVGIFKGKLLLTAAGVQLFSMLAIIITIFFGCMAVGIMSSGKRLDGLKYFPILALIGLGLLFAIRFGLSTILGGMLSGTG